MGLFFSGTRVCLSVKLGFVAFTFSECGSLIFVKVNLQGLFFSGARVCVCLSSFDLLLSFIADVVH